MAARRCEISFGEFSSSFSFGRVSTANKCNIFQHEKRNFVSPPDHVILFLLYKTTTIPNHSDKDVFGDFPNVSKHFPKISEDKRRLPKTFE